MHFLYISDGIKLQTYHKKERGKGTSYTSEKNNRIHPILRNGIGYYLTISEGIDSTVYT